MIEVKNKVIIFGVFIVGLLAAWVYRTNYETRDAQNYQRELRARIAEEKEAIAMLRAEWAFLNRPERLMVLVRANANRLGLREIDETSYGDVTQVVFREDALLAPLPEDEMAAIDALIDELVESEAE